MLDLVYLARLEWLVRSQKLEDRKGAEVQRTDERAATRAEAGRRKRKAGRAAREKMAG
jgi:hypothetical protein